MLAIAVLPDTGEKEVFAIAEESAKVLRTDVDDGVKLLSEVVQNASVQLDSFLRILNTFDTGDD